MRVSRSSFVNQLTLRFSLFFALLLVFLEVSSYTSLEHVLLRNLDRELAVLARNEADFAQQGIPPSAS